jgi:hypothetical protein
MKSKTAMMLLLITGLLLVIAGLRDIFAPAFLNMNPEVMSPLEITMKFAAAAIFWIAAAGFYKSLDHADGVKNG